MKETFTRHTYGFKFLPLLKLTAILRYMRLLLAIFILSISSITFSQATFTSVQDGNWNDGATWGNTSPGSVGIDYPGSNDSAVIQNNNVITLIASQYVHAVNIENGTLSLSTFVILVNSGGITVTNSGTLSGGTVRFNTASSSNYIINEGSVSISNLQFTGGNDVDLYVSGSSSVNISNMLYFNEDRCSLINNGIISAFIVRVATSGTFPANGDEDNSIINNSAALLNVTTDINFNNCRFVIDNYGTINHLDDFLNIESGEVQLNNYSGATYSFGGNAGGSDMALELYCNLDGENTFNYTFAGDQTIYKPEDGYYHLVTSGGSGIKTLEGDINVFGDLTIGAGTTLDVGNGLNYDISTYGNWDHEETAIFNERFGTVTFAGSEDQTISGTSSTPSEIFYNLVIDNPASVILNTGQVRVDGTLTMTRGNIYSNSYELYINSSASGAISYTSGTIIGTLRRDIATGANTYLFPIGTAEYYRPATLAFASSSSATSITAEFVEADPGSFTSYQDDVSLWLYNIFDEGYWTLTNTTLTNISCVLSLEGNGFTSYNIDNNTRITADIGSGWEDQGSHNAGSSSGNVVARNLPGSVAASSSFNFGFATGCNTVASAGSDETICRGGDVTLGASGGGTYSWSPSYGLNATDVAGPVASPEMTTTYTVAVTSGGCTARDEVTVFVNPLPAAALGYAYDKTITIDAAQVAGANDLINFPVLINITNDADMATTANGGNVENASGYDILFTDEDYNLLDHELVSYNGSQGDLMAWVRVPALSATVNTELHVIYGNPQVSTDLSSPMEAWDAGYMGVWHFDGDVDDATSNGEDLTNVNTSDYASSKILNGRELSNSSVPSSNASGQHLQLSSGVFSGIGNFSFEGWVYLDDDGTAWERIFDFGQDAVSPTHYFFFTPSHDAGTPAETRSYITTTGNGGEEGVTITNPTANTSQWIHWGVVLNSKAHTMAIYKNGSLYGLGHGVDLTPDDLSATDNFFGRSLWDGDEYLDGKFDEFRISSVARSASWMQTAYNNQNSPSSFYSVSSQAGHAPIVDTVCQNEEVNYSVPDVYDSYTWAVTNGSITSGDGTNEITVLWETVGTGTIVLEATKTITGCSGTSLTLDVEVMPLPTPTITGISEACPNYTGEIYSVTEVAGHSYSWYISDGTITDNTGDSITVDWPGPPGYDTVIVTETIDATGCFFRDTMVIVYDTAKPEITACAPTDTLYLDASCEVSLPDYTGDITATDNCTTLTITQNPASGFTLSGVDTVEVTLYAEDGSGNIDSCKFYVYTWDTVSPNITLCAPTDTLYLNGTCQIAAPDYTSLITVTDNCDGDLTITQSPAITSILNGVDTTEFTLYATDDWGNVDSCKFYVYTWDTTSPNFTVCAPTDTLFLNSSCEVTVPDYTSLVTVSDNCDGDLLITQNPAATNTLTGVDTIEFTIYATDDWGNVDSCKFNVYTWDTISPEIADCATTDTLYLDNSCEITIPDYITLITATDNCDGDVTITQYPAIGSTPYGVDTIEFTLYATDDWGNVDSCKFNVYAWDTTAPELLTCVTGDTLYLDASCNTSLPDYRGMVTLNDNCGGIKNITQLPVQTTPISGVDTVTVTIYVTDNSDNVGSCSFDVFVWDTTAPNITVCAPTDTLYLNASCQATLPDYRSLITVADNCDPSLTI
ncbi:MAG: DUF2341 domain-containing protein, partial [Bacteroidales bacterium]|nr:DUF2341 domain-containing protein [Bacteroidales bacterium]